MTTGTANATYQMWAMTTKMTTRFLVATTISDPFYFDSVGGLKPPRVGRTY